MPRDRGRGRGRGGGREERGRERGIVYWTLLEREGGWEEGGHLSVLSDLREQRAPERASEGA